MQKAWRSVCQKSGFGVVIKGVSCACHWQKVKTCKLTTSAPRYQVASRNPYSLRADNRLQPAKLKSFFSFN
jgi:hypothetical protein